MHYFDLAYIKNFYTINLDCFDYQPSNGASGGIITIWKSSRFVGNEAFDNEFALSIEFTSIHSGARWTLTNVYAPCTPEGKTQFLDWFKNVDIDDEDDWLVVGDFNLIRSPSDSFKPGGLETC